MRIFWMFASIVTFLAIAMLCTPVKAHADYFNYPCNYPFVGGGAGVNLIVDAGGQWCDGPTEINWSHYHCESGGANVNIGAFAFAPVGGPVSLGGFGGNGVGGKGGDCYYRCPDGTVAPFPNPPAAWIKHMVLDPKNNDCDQHMGIAGPTSTPLVNELPGNMPPGQGAPDGVAVPQFPGGLPEGQHNPPALPGIPPPNPQVPPGPIPPGPDSVPMPSGKPVAPDATDSSPLTPGSPMQLP